MHVFVSHAAADREAAARLRADLAQLGRQVTVDRGEPVGPDWWPGVLHRLRATEVFVLVLSPDSARSPGCLAQLRHALALRRPVLLVPARRASPPPEAVDAPVFDPTGLGPERVGKLRAALLSLPSTPPLPDPLPPDPPVPYLEPYRDRVLDPALTEPELRTIFEELRARLRVDPDRAGVWALLVLLRDRQDVPRPVAGELERLLAPGWQPDPEHRVERRYWDGAQWTTLVRHEGREFSERRVPPPEATWSGSPRRPHPVDPPPRRPVRGRRRWLWVSGAAVLGVAAVAAGWLWFSGPTLTPVSVARTFVDAVNVRDLGALRGVACEQVRPHAETSFLGGGYRLTLESVDDEADPPTFTVLATDESTGVIDRRTFPFVQEDGEWRVCD
ncbi:TIR domain-containing protein [Actinokineospora sp. G85]|uniref:TIR domain-containing protein n=1 Tax=Actinokineospora sp. G85 TaxID=3406626 RepID=UPI003C74428F